VGGHTVTPLGNGSVVRFAPQTGFTGDATFRYTVNDGHGGTATALVTVTVVEADDGDDRAPSEISDVQIRPSRLTSLTRARVSFTVMSDGEPASGRVIVREGDRVLGRDRLDDDGEARVRLRRLQPGEHELELVYGGSDTSDPVSA